MIKLHLLKIKQLYLIKIENIQITTYNNHTMKDNWLTQSYNRFVLIFPTKSPKNAEFECWTCI